MRARNVMISVFLSLLLFRFAFAGDKYEIDPAHSFLGFSVKHLVISNTKGEFNDFSGTINLNEDDLTESAVAVTIKVASIDTDEEKRDNHLRSADFFDAETYPEITFKSKRVEKNGDDHVLVGDLTIRGVTREVAIPFELNGPIKGMRGEKRIGAQGSLTINRQDFGVSWNRMLDSGGFVVGDDVKIDLEIEAVNQPEGTD